MIVTNTLEKKTFEPILFDQVIDPLSPGSGGVCRVKDGDVPFLPQKLEKIVESRVSHGRAERQCFLVFCPEKLMIPETFVWSLASQSRKLSPVGCGGLAPVLAHIEGPGVEAAPAEVPGQLGPDVGLPPGGHPHHRDHVRHRAVPGAVPRGDLPALLLRHDLDREQSDTGCGVV